LILREDIIVAGMAMVLMHSAWCAYKNSTNTADIRGDHIPAWFLPDLIAAMLFTMISGLLYMHRQATYSAGLLVMSAVWTAVLVFPRQENLQAWRSLRILASIFRGIVILLTLLVFHARWDAPASVYL
jgi:hypothetical protein